MYIVQEAMLQSPRMAASQRREIGLPKDELDTPCLLLDLDLLDSNICRMAELASSASVRLRPHAKTHKLVQVAERQIAAGSEGLTVAKLGEAELFAEHGVRDLFIAYPLWGERKWERLCRLAESADVRVAADSLEVCDRIASAAAARGLSIQLRIEVDTGFGRCGVQTVEEARALAEHISRLHGLELVGVMSFAGQTYTPGAEPVRAVASADARRLVEVAQALGESGFHVPEISVGGTPGASYVAEMQGITEMRPGTYVFSDRDQVHLGWGTLADCALTVLSAVVSRPTPTRAVIDAGTKALGADRAGTVEGWGAIREQPSWKLPSLNEEHGLIELAPGQAPIGTIVEIVPNHACGALNMHDWVAVVRGGIVEDWWRIEGRGLVR
jgi:D-serine deaminase-like pyridoxal phosphate-dependent protein